MGRANDYICPGETTIIGRKGTINKPIYVEEPFWNVDTAFGLVSNKESLIPRYLYHFCRYFNFGALSTTSAIPSLTSKNIERIKLWLPDVDEQEVMVQNLDACLHQIKICEQSLVSFDELIKSRFVEMFGDGSYPMVPMGKLVRGIVAGTNVGGQQRPISVGEFAVLKISAVTKGVFDSTEYKVVDDTSRIKMIHPKKGDLLFSRANTSEMVGATAIVDRDYDYLFIPDKLWRLDPAKGVNTVFLKSLLSAPATRAEMSKVATGSSGSMQNISMAKFRELPAFLPSIEEQEAFAAFVQQVDKLKYGGPSDICPIRVKCMG